MASPAIAGSNRYIPEGVSHFYFIPGATGIASKTAPTRTELNSGTDLTPEVAAAGDWEVVSAAVDTPDLATQFTSQIPGKITVSNSTLNMYADSASADVRTLLPRSTVGWIVKFPEGDVAGHKCDVFPVKVGSAGKPTAFGNPSTINVMFYVTSIPAENVTVPA